LDAKFLGPFKVLEKINSVTFKLKLPKSYKIHNVFHSSLLKLCNTPKYKIRRFEPNLNNIDEFYKVERILDHKFIRIKIYFLIKWNDYSNDENSGEPEANIDPELIENYWDQIPDLRENDGNYLNYNLYLIIYIGKLYP
jgi:hypothetical protein